jgi:AraC-like DNA-binding protein
LNETDIYRELVPPVWARGAVACFWVRRGDGSQARVLPDGCTDIVWRAEREPIVAGPDTEAWVSPTRPGELIVGARLLPGAGGTALGVPLAELRNTRLPLSALDAGWARELDGSLDPAAAPGAVARVTLRIVAGVPPDPAIRAAVARLLVPGERVDELASSLGFSERQLRRRFLAAVGYGPKMLQRVLRLRRFLARAGNPSGGLARAASEAGYADQAHLSRECRELTGLTPGELVASGWVAEGSTPG